MSLIILILAIAFSLVLIGIISLPINWFDAINLPYWIYLIGGFVVFSWLLGD